MSLRLIAAILAGILGTLALAASIMLVVTTTVLHDTSAQLLDTTESITATEELEASLLTHSQQSLLWIMTGDEAHLDPRREARASLDKWFVESHRHIGNERERALLSDAEAAVGRYLDTRDRLERSGAPVSDIAKGVAAETGTAVLALTRLTEENVAQAQAAYLRAASYDELANKLGLLVVGLVLVLIPVVLLLLRRYVYRPLLQLNESILTFRRGGTVAPTNLAVTELRTIATTFADMATQIQKQKENQVRYLAAVAHDLRNPIGALKMSADLTLLDYADELPPEIVRMLEVMQRQSAHLERLVADLLDTARSEGGELSLKREARDLIPVVRGCCELFRTFSPAHEIVVRTPGQAVVVDIDPQRIAQVVNNLISNAIKYSPYGGKVTITVEDPPDGGGAKEALVSVTDSGLGIDTSDVETIFEPFHRAATTKDTIPGVGLGLFTAKKIIAAHGGRIEVHSRLGEGATFVVRIPVTDGRFLEAPKGGPGRDGEAVLH